jgi:hypothetical protein
MLGAVRLLHHRGAENHMYGVEHLLFTELRPYWVSLAFGLYSLRVNEAFFSVLMILPSFPLDMYLCYCG